MIHHPSRGLLARLVMVIAMTAAALSLPAPPASAATEYHLYPPGGDASAVVKAQFEKLEPGDILWVHPGVYDIGPLVPKLKAGASGARILVSATDPYNKPLFRGQLVLNNPTNWTINGINMEATVPNAPALGVFGGSYWLVQLSEFFGAANTGYVANVGIGSYLDPLGGPTVHPYSWQFVHNCVHDAYTGDPSQNNYHNVYVSISGSGPGWISRNLIYNAARGAQVKVGHGGGNDEEVNATGVVVSYNTLVTSYRALEIVGNGYANQATHNLFKIAAKRGAKINAPYTPTYPLPNTIASNYFRTPDADTVIEITPDTAAHGNGVENNNVKNGANFNFNNQANCSGFQPPSGSQAANYGHYAPGGSIGP